MSWLDALRNIKTECDSDIEWNIKNNGSQILNQTNFAMDVNQVQALIVTAVSEALAQQEQRFQTQLNAMNERVNNLSIEVPQAEPYKTNFVDPQINCNIPLDIIP